MLTRRALLKGLAVAPLALRPAAFMGSALTAGQACRADLAFADTRYTPHYPARSPLEDVLRLVPPGSDNYTTERYAAEIEVVLKQWGALFEGGTLQGLGAWLAPDVQACSLTPEHTTELRSGYGIDSARHEFPQTLQRGADATIAGLEKWIGRDAKVRSSEFQIIAIEQREDDPRTVHLRVRYSMVTAGALARREQRVGHWRMDWTNTAPEGQSPAWRVHRWTAETETHSTVTGPGIVDVTAEALGGAPSYAAQLLLGADEWRARLDAACGMDVYGNNGVAAGDFDGDGFDDIYVCQTAGLPNRLYRNRGNGTFEDVTDKAGVGVLDNTACALFADFRNIGRQDLLVVCNSGPLLFQNQGDGTFALKKDAFRFSRPPQGTFTHAALADYDGDGRLDVYFCLYSYYLGLDQYHYPAPYFDARNGPPNFLMQNQGDGTFVDRTENAGLQAENDRYSFSCAWGFSNQQVLPDLYVVNDFGRNNLYRNQGNGTFVAASAQAHVEDVGAGMSACWTDYDNDGHPDLYVANMWSAAGQRVSQQPQFHGEVAESIRGLYRGHAEGNALYRNEGSGTFAGRAQASGADMGRWAWGSDFFDVDNDGYPDLYVTNGYITAPGSKSRLAGPPLPGDLSQKGAESDHDLASFFWRQVVANSPNDATPSLAYERGWNALNELIRSDHSWSGSERNVFLANNRDGTFSEISGAIGLDFLEDGRSFALADLDGDGRLEIVLKNRNAPQLKILRNATGDLGNSIAFRLRGTRSNRDAVGSTVTVQVGNLRQTRSLQAGSGFLSQHSKELFFGLGRSSEVIRATVRWPSGLVQHFEHLPRMHRVLLEEGKAGISALPFTGKPLVSARPEEEPAAKACEAISRESWLLDPLKAPAFALADAGGQIHTLEEHHGRCVYLHFWAAAAPRCLEQLRTLQQARAKLSNAGANMLLVNVDGAQSRDQARAVAERLPPGFPVLYATDECAGTYNIIFRYLFDRRADLALPTTFLVDTGGMILKVYQGAVQVNTLLEDTRALPASEVDRLKRALPFTGTNYHGKFTRNEFTYGIAMFQHGYLDQAAAAFEQVIAKLPQDAEAHYNLGTLYLRRNNLPEAERLLKQTLELKPDYPEAWNNLGMMAAQAGRMGEAVQDFQKSLSLRPTYVTALLNLGNLYRRQKAFAAAQQSLNKAVQLQPDDPEVQYGLGMLYAQQDQIDLAIQALKKASALRPGYPEALNNLGVIYVRQGKYTDAEQAFLDCIRLVPTFEESYVNLARLYLLQNDKVRAKAALQQLLLVKPESTQAKQGLQALSSSP